MKGEFIVPDHDLAESLEEEHRRFVDEVTEQVNILLAQFAEAVQSQVHQSQLPEEVSHLFSMDQLGDMFSTQKIDLVIARLEHAGYDIQREGEGLRLYYRLLLTVDQTAQEMNLDLKAVWRMIIQKELQSIELYPGQKRVYRSSVNTYLKERRNRHEPENQS